MKKLSVISVLFSAGVLASACVAQREDSGYMRTNAEFDRILPGTSTNKDVLELLGSPSSYSSFGDETWYYISARKESVAFFKPKIIDQGATAIVFDKQGVVQAVNKFTSKDQQDITVATQKTPTEGNRITLWQQLLGNLGRFNSEGGNLPGQRSGGSAGR